MGKNYGRPEIQIIAFEAEEVITMSTDGGEIIDI
jgi:hypothetical protein